MKVKYQDLPPFSRADMSYTGVPRASFWLFFWTALPIVYWVGSRNGEGGLLVAGWLLVFPGCLLVGWYYIYKIWMSIGMSIGADSRRGALGKAFRERLAIQGNVEYIDSNVQSEAPSGLALVGGRLFAIKDFRVVEVPPASIRGYDWSINETSVIKSGNAAMDMQLTELETRQQAKTNGFRIQTLDPSTPEIMLYTTDESVCKRWATIVENIWRSA